MIIVGLPVPCYLLIFFKLRKCLLQRAEAVEDSKRENERANIKRKMAIIFLYFAAVCQFCVTRVANAALFIFFPNIAYDLNYRILSEFIYSLSETIMEVAMCKSLNYSLQ
jgi:hypothetical protein